MWIKTWDISILELKDNQRQLLLNYGKRGKNFPGPSTSIPVFTNRGDHLYFSLWNINFVGSEVHTPPIMKISVFWDITPCSPLKVNRLFGVTCRFHLQGWRISTACYLCHASFLAYSSNLKMETTYFSEMSVGFQRNTRNYILEDRTFKIQFLCTVCA
jgi:hypothetical protein